MGVHPQLLQVVRERELEIQQGQVQMNCEMCKFRLAAIDDHSHHHHSHDHSHHHHTAIDPYATVEDYHQRIWKTP